MIPMLLNIVSIIVSLSAIYISYHIYKMNHMHMRVDRYLAQIVDLYFKIKDDGALIKNTKKSDELSLSEYYRRVEINAALLGYYVKKFPIKYSDKNKFEQIVTSLAHAPNLVNDYEKLGDEFKKFCKKIGSDNACKFVIE